jgi:hypothetical protein
MDACDYDAGTADAIILDTRQKSQGRTRESVEAQLSGTCYELELIAPIASDLVGCLSCMTVLLDVVYGE